MKKYQMKSHQMMKLLINIITMKFSQKLNEILVEIGILQEIPFFHGRASN